MTEKTILWTNQRKAFGKKLISQPVVRQQIAEMIALSEAVNYWYEAVTFQMCTLPAEEQTRIGSQISILKVHFARSLHRVTDHAVQLFGGRGITQSGMGEEVERIHRACKMPGIFGGANEIMADVGVRLALKELPKNAKL